MSNSNSIELTPEQAASHVYSSPELLFNPYNTGTESHERFVNELLRLCTEGAKNG